MIHAFTSAGCTAPLGNHSFPMDKYRLVPSKLTDDGTLAVREVSEPEAAAAADVLLVHTPDYVSAFVRGTIGRAAMLRIGLPWSRQLVRRSFTVVGGTLAAARAALQTGVAVNLAGGTHHAFADRGEGYCVFNDLVVAARRLRAEARARRFLIIDLDVHQGNGTAALCRQDPDVFTFSMHAEGNYPARKEPGSWDIGLPDGSGDERYLEALAAALSRLPRRFSPDLILYQAGVDVLAGDRLGRLALTTRGVAERDRLVCDLARRTGLPLAVTLGGGYARDIGLVVEAHCQTVRIAKRLLG